MLEALQAALAAVTNHEDECTERWQTAQKQFEQAKATEYTARCAMQDAADVRERLDNYLAALKLGGQS